MYNLTADKIRENLDNRLAEEVAELEALKAVKVNTKHKVMTNRAVEGATVFNYIDINKALKVSYSVKYSDGHTRYMSREITIYSYEDKDGKEIGVDGFTRISRTLEPLEVEKLLQDIILAKEKTVIELKSEYERADEIATEHNKLVEQLNKFNDSVSYASDAKIKF